MIYNNINKYTFYHKSGKTIIIHKNQVYWGGNLEWYVEHDSNFQVKKGVKEMPRGVWCCIKSYQFNIGGHGWKLL
jgi:hypothetical protein